MCLILTWYSLDALQVAHRCRHSLVYGGVVLLSLRHVMLVVQSYHGLCIRLLPGVVLFPLVFCKEP